jgi:Fur family transcriptional regulator, peroxide stress response regulator
MSASTDAIVLTMKQQGLRVTPQRFAVYANLLQRCDHPTAEQILTELNQDGPVSSLATVYSSLQALRTAGLIKEVLLEAGVGRYDAKVQPHHHLCCNGCGSIADIPWAAFTDLDVSQMAAQFQAQTYEVVVRGICQSCQNAD